MGEYIGLDVSLKETAVSIRRGGKRAWRGKCLSGRRLVLSAAAVAPRTSLRFVRNEHWKNRPAKPHDAAAYAEREDDHAPGIQRLLP